MKNHVTSKNKLMKSSPFIVACFIAALYTKPLVAQQTPATPHLVSFFFKPYLGEDTETSPALTLQDVLNTPGSLSRALLYSPIRYSTVQGIYVTYQGIVTQSDFNGQVTFPLQTTVDTLHLFVIPAEQLKPILIFGNTVDHLEVLEPQAAKFYRYTRTKDDKKKKYTWHTQAIRVPKNHRIPDNALIIMASPSQIVIEEGTHTTDITENFILPAIYVKNAITIDENALQFLRTTKFFKPVRQAFGFARERYASKIVS